MVLRRDGDAAVVAIAQPSHAWLSGQLARAWGNEMFGAVDPWEEVCLAAEQHDLAMAEWDAEPTLNPETGLPYSFTEMPVDIHLDLWDRAWELALQQSRYAALLVSMHGTALYGMRDLGKLDQRQRERVESYLERQRGVQAALRRSLRDPSAVARNQRLVWTWDAFSLALCLGWPPYTLSGVPTADGEVEIELSPLAEWTVAVMPWPFASPAVQVRTEGRRLEGRFDSEEEMRAGLRDADWTELVFELVPGAGSAPAA